MDRVIVAPASERRENEQPEDASELALARFEGRNEPWAQSWKTMNVRTRNPAAGIASRSASGSEAATSLYIRTDMARYGTTDVISSTRLCPRWGWAYLARDACSSGRFD